MLNEYYTQVDKVQDLFSKTFKDYKKKVVVLIDELDRCDPGEAFEVIKKLRIFFAMRDVPFVFVISANPEPIGLAIKHQYGLNTGTSDYETFRIMEKYVDEYFEMNQTASLSKYINRLLESKNLSLTTVTFVSKLDVKVQGGSVGEDIVLNAKLRDSIDSSSAYFRNLRLLEKSFHYAAQNGENPHLLWTKWHLEILKQANSKLRQDVERVTSELTKITELTYVDTIRELDRCGFIDRSNWKIKDGVSTLVSKYGKTVFSIYRSFYWERTRHLLQRNETYKIRSEDVSILNQFLNDDKFMDFLISMSLIKFWNAEKEKEFLIQILNPKKEFDVSIEVTLEVAMQFGYLLANYR